MYIKANIVAPTVPAIHPSIDFFGLTLLNLCFPNLFPIQYANMSVPHDAMNMYPYSIFPFCILSIIVKNIKNGGI